MNPVDSRRTHAPQTTADYTQCIEGPENHAVRLAALEHLLQTTVRKRQHSSPDRDLK